MLASSVLWIESNTGLHEAPKAAIERPARYTYTLSSINASWADSVGTGVALLQPDYISLPLAPVGYRVKPINYRILGQIKPDQPPLQPHTFHRLLGVSHHLRGIALYRRYQRHILVNVYAF